MNLNTINTYFIIQLKNNKFDYLKTKNINFLNLPYILTNTQKY